MIQYREKKATCRTKSQIIITSIGYLLPLDWNCSSFQQCLTTLLVVSMLGHHNLGSDRTAHGATLIISTHPDHHHQVNKITIATQNDRDGQ